MKISLSQNNFTAGDLDGNYKIIKERFLEADAAGCNLVVFSELAICGYPVDDLVNKSYFIEQIDLYIAELAKITRGCKCAILVGAPIRSGEKLFNGVYFLQNGDVAKKIYKKELPNYKLFDEKRYFSAAENLSYIELEGKRLTVLICEDVWNEKNIALVEKHQSEAILVVNASPFAPDKYQQRIDACAKFSSKAKAPLLYVNQVGGIDSFLFDGNSFVINKQGEVVEKLKGFGSDDKFVKIDEISNGRAIEDEQNNLSDLYSGALLALRDYVIKTGFKKVLIGMSGGIDSALVACLAVDALGSNNVRLVALPTKFNSSESYRDAVSCAQNLGVNLQQVAIQNIVDSSLGSLKEQFSGLKRDVTEENVQSRIRGTVLMAISNKFNELLITTGNKSEMATGYATIYGDMNGAFNPIKDLYKTQVFALSEWRNNNIPDISVYKNKNLIPSNIISKEPSAELAFDQKDSDSLPDYQLLDLILYKLIEEEKSVIQITKEVQCEPELVQRIARLFYQNEYKRKQAVIGPKLSKMSFDRDRRYLISNKFWQ